VVSLDPDAEHGDGEQVLGGELVGDFRPVSSSADPFEVRAGVACPACCGVGGEVPLYQAGGEVLVAELRWNVDAHDDSFGAGPAGDGTAVAVPGGPLAAEDRVVPAAVRHAVEVLLENPEDVPSDLYEQLDKFADELAAGTARGAGQPSTIVTHSNYNVTICGYCAYIRQLADVLQCKLQDICRAIFLPPGSRSLAGPRQPTKDPVIHHDGAGIP
jgi:hypothetical protein